MKNAFIAIVAILFMTSCSSTKFVKFEEPENEIVKTTSLKNFLSENKTPKVVLRFKNDSQEIIPNESNDFIFNAIENEFLSNGFIVRDRELFNRIVENQGNNSDYEMLKEKSDTDLIIEIANIDPSVAYTTNTYYDQKDRAKENPAYPFLRYGAKIEYKVIMIEDNQFAGVYNFNFAPCSTDVGCVVTKEQESKDKLRYKLALNPNVLETKAGAALAEEFKGVNKNELEEFIKESAQQLVEEMRK